MEQRNLYYFVSDVHLGLDYLDPVARERKFADFLLQLPSHTKKLFLLGDIFDFWYEYKFVIPRGFTRTLGALAQLADRGVEIHFFNGNHDIWTYDYFQRELGFIMERQPAVFELEGKYFCMGHGDGLMPGDRWYKLMKWGFNNKFLQRLFSAIHPRWALGLGHSWSRHNRLTKGEEFKFSGEDEMLVKFAHQFQKTRSEDEKIDFFVFGHYHYKIQHQLACGGELTILGEWINHCDYLVFDGEKLESKVFNG